MKTTLIFFSLLTVCALLFFLAPHHHRKPAIFQACTLGEIYREFFGDMSSFTSPRHFLFVILVMVAMASTWYPVFFVLLARCVSTPAGNSVGPVLILGGIFAAVGAF